MSRSAETFQQPLRNLPKHKKYSSSYTRGDLYWGLGVEHETYIRSSQEKVFSSFSNCMEPERYSVSYYKSYKEENLPIYLQTVIENTGGKLKVPILLNSHSFTHSDKFNTHMTTFEKDPKQNPKADTQCLFQWMKTQSKWFSQEYEKSFMWDGDSIEFMTQGFYKTNVKDVLAELQSAHSNFLIHLNSLPKQGLLAAYSPFSLSFPENPPFASHLTNLKHITMFNNGTIHINITLPTRLSLWKRQKAADWNSFVDSHRKLARCIQWLEPLWIAAYGSSDPFSSFTEKASSASQRIAVSRYIGLGTFDTEGMPRGKILQIPNPSLSWYEEFYKDSCYAPLNEIGLDINFNKHNAHGLELRFFDQISYDILEEVLYQIIQLADFSLKEIWIKNPRESAAWRQIALDCLQKGKSWKVSYEQILLFASILQISTPIPSIPLSPELTLQWLFSQLPKKGICWDSMARK